MRPCVRSIVSVSLFTALSASVASANPITIPPGLAAGAPYRLAPHRLGRWLANLEARAHPNVVAVALANKLVRTAWAVLQRNSHYDGRLLANA
jgi:hypothetical protein